jgi:AraC-like DNA-binding protein
VSVHLVLSFLREAQHPVAEQILEREGVDLSGCVRPEARIPRSMAIRALEAYVRATGDTTIGLRAGLRLEPGDLDVVELAARCCATLRDAIACAARYMPLLSDGADLTLVEDGDDALCSFRGNGGAAHDAASDFVVAAAVSLLRRYADLQEPPTEVHLARRGGLDKARYEGELQARVIFGMPHDAVAIHRCQLSRGMLRHNAALQRAFEGYARERLDRTGAGLRRRVADLATEELRAGRLTMLSVAGRMGASSATLRRRLEDEGTTFREIVDEVKRELAEQYLLDRRRSISEIGFALGFSNVGAFHRAFRRWKSISPSQYRSHLEPDWDAPSSCEADGSRR